MMVQATRVIVYDVWIQKLVLHKYIQRVLDITGYSRDCEVIARYLLVLKGMNSSFNGVWKLYACTICLWESFRCVMRAHPQMDPDCKEILRKLARHFKNLKAGENAIPFSQNLYRLLPSNSKKLEHRHGFCPSKARQGSRGLLLLNLSICIYVIYIYTYIYTSYAL